MKKTYTLIGFILASGFVFGQSGGLQTAKISSTVKNIVNVDPHNFHQSGTSGGGNRAIIWENDFSNAADWNIYNDADDNDDDWVIGTAGPAGSFAIDPIASATATNGFALFDSDLLCSSNQIANITTIDPIDCSLFSSVQIRFSQYFRRFVDSTYVLASLDGINWTRYEVNGSLGANDYNENNVAINPSEVTANITSLAANQSTVYIGFQFYSPTSFGAQAGCAYSWQVDDVVLETLPDYELGLGTVFNADYFPSSLDLTVTSGAYYAIPVAQATPVKIWTVVNNLGGNTANNVTVELNLDFNGTSVGTWSSDVLSLEVGESDSILITTDYTPTATGTIDATLNLIYTENDELTTENNTKSTNIEITDDVYALDEGGNMSFNGFDAAAFGEWKILNLYEIQSETFAKSVTFALTANAGDESQIIGQSIFIDLIDLQEGGDFVPVTNTGDNVIDITSADLSGAGDLQLVTYTFEEPIPLEAGKTYGAQLTFSLVDVPIFFANSGSSNFDFNLQFQDDAGPFTTNNWLIRLNTQDEIGISETQSGNLILSQNQPNPVKENTVIAYELKSAERVTLEIYDITGKLISSINEGNQAAGNYTINYNASKLNAGIYTYTLVAGDARLTKKMTVIK